MQLVGEIVAARMLDAKPSTIQKWRVKGVGPRWVRVGRLVKYDVEDLKSWAESHKVNSTSEARAA